MLKKILLALLATLLTLAAAEGALRLTGFGRVTPELSFGRNTRAALRAGRFRPDPDLFWKLPAAGEAGLDRRLGAVHPDLPFPPHGSRPRILVLGDSCSRLAVDGLPYPAGLRRRLGETEAEIVTAAVPGYTTHQGLVWLCKQLLELEPDVVIVYFGWNDHWRATGLTDAELSRRLQRGRLRLATLVERLRRGRERPLRVPPAAYGENLRRIVAAVREQGGKVVLLAAPHHLTPAARDHLVETRYLLPDDDPTRLHRAYLDTLRSVAAATGATLVDAAAVFPQLPQRPPLLHRDGIHPTRHGHAVLAALLADAVGRLLPGIAPSDTAVAGDPVAIARRALAGAGQGGAP